MLTLKLIERLYPFVLGLALMSAAHAEFSVDELLQQVKTGSVQDRQQQQQRLQEFIHKQDQQSKRLADITQTEEELTDTSSNQEQIYEHNEQQLANLQARLNERLGNLKELFGVLQQVAADANAEFNNSLTQIHHPNRGDFLQGFAQKMGQTKALPSIKEIEQLWFELHREMTETGKVERFDYPVLTTLGKQRVLAVTRVGTFNLISDSAYLQWIPQTGRVVAYQRQPANQYLLRLKRFTADESKHNLFAIDPTRGQLLALLVKAPSWVERITQGGIIGYIIIVLGAVSDVIALIRLLSLALTQFTIERQAHQPHKPGKNPLGRILAVYQHHKTASVETLELKLGEAVLRELPRVNRGLSALKIVAAVAPLMGLLGTVTGMIVTFQAITLFGAGDPKLMAGGISQALVTTVLGLVVAIPMLLLHNLLQSRADLISHLLQQQGVALVAEQAETHSTIVTAK